MNSSACGICILVLHLSVIAAMPEPRKFSVAQILDQADKLNNETVKIHGDLHLSSELSSVADDSSCTGARKQPCKLSFAIGICRISGKQYTGLECMDGLNKLIDRIGFRMDSHKSVVIKDVVVIGVLSTIREDLISDPSVPNLPRIGFGHLGIFPAEISATKIYLDKAVVEAAP